jgi:hypothetical protein
MRRYGQKRDAIEPAIIAALSKRGIEVHQLPGGNGKPDLLCYDPASDRWMPGEVKSGQRRKRAYVMKTRTRKKGTSDSPYVVNSTIASRKQQRQEATRRWPIWASVEDALESFWMLPQRS